MSVNRIRQKITFADGTKNPFGRKNIPQPGIVIVNAYTLIAALYCVSSTILFYYLVENIFLAIIHLLALVSVITNYFVLIKTKHFQRATNIILTTGTIVVISLFATGGWENTGYLWPFAYLPFAFFLSDRNTVIGWVAALFIGCLLVVLLHFTRVITIPYSTVAIVNYFAALLIFTVCIFLFQKATIKREEFLSYTENLLEAAPDAVIVIDDEGIILKWNPKSEILFGWTADQVLGKRLSETIIPPRYREAHEKGMKHFLETGEGPVLGKAVEIQAINKDNVEFDVALSISPATVHQKHLFIGFISDITERKKSEEKIKESEYMFSTLFYKSPVMKAITEAPTGKYIEVNDAFADFFEHTREEIPGKTSVELNMIVHPEERDEILKNLRRDGFVRNAEIQVTTRYGKTRWISSNIDSMNLNGKDCFLTAAIDITERKIAGESLLKLSQELEQKVLERTKEINKSLREVSDYKYALDESSIVAITDQKGIIKHANDNFCKISKFSREELIGQDHRIINSGFHPKDFIRNLWITIASGKIWKGELKNRAKDGTIYWVDTTIIPFLNERGKPYQYVAIRADITGRKLAEEENRKLNEDLELRVKQRTEEMEAFSYSISHDLRTPLRAVHGYAKILEEDYNKLFDEEGKRLLAVVQENAKKMGVLIDDVLAFSRLGRKDINKINVNMKLLTENALEELTKSIDNKAEIKINNLHSVMADYTLINQVMTNLLSNAIKYSFYTEKPFIEIYSEKKNGEVIYAVSDNGAGFDMQYVHKLYGVFQRLHATEDFEGTGVGLAIVHRIVTKHGGKVWAEGEIGKGATFYFSLPS